MPEDPLRRSRPGAFPRMTLEAGATRQFLLRALLPWGDLGQVAGPAPLLSAATLGAFLDGLLEDRC